MYNSMNNPYYNPYQMTAATGLQQQYGTNQYGRQEVVRVNGKNGAQTYQMPPNSSIILLDESAPIVWLKTTDGAGYATVTPYDIIPHKDEPPVDTKSLQQRISRLEEIINEQSDAKQSAKKITAIKSE